MFMWSWGKLSGESWAADTPGLHYRHRNFIFDPQHCVCFFLSRSWGTGSGRSLNSHFLPATRRVLCVCWGYFVQNQAAYGSRLLGVQGLWDRDHEGLVTCAVADEPSVSVEGRGGQKLQLDCVGCFPCQCPFVTATVELLSARCFPPWSPPCYKEEPNSPL